MGVLEYLSADHVSVASAAEGVVLSKRDALHRLAVLLADGILDVSSAEIERVLGDRERIQSTGVGGGVAIPHGSIDNLSKLVGAMLVCPSPIEFDAIDRAPVSILFAVIGPKRATGEHLKALARVSRLLRDETFRAKLLRAKSGTDAFHLLSAEEGRVGS